MSHVLVQGKHMRMYVWHLTGEWTPVLGLCLPFHLFSPFLQSFHSYPCCSTPHLGGEQPGRNNVSSCFSHCGGTLASSFAKIRPSRFPVQTQPCGRLNSRVQAGLIGNQSKCWWCHFFPVAIPLCNKHLLPNDYINKKTRLLPVQYVNKEINFPQKRREKRAWLLNWYFSTCFSVLAQTCNVWNVPEFAARKQRSSSNHLIIITLTYFFAQPIDAFPTYHRICWKNQNE